MTKVAKSMRRKVSSVISEATEAKGMIPEETLALSYQAIQIMESLPREKHQEFYLFLKETM